MLQKLPIIFLILLSVVSNFALAQQASYNKDSLMTAVLESVNKDSVAQTIQSLQNFNTRFALAPNHKQVALFVADKLTALGYADVKLDSFQLDSLQWPPNSGIFHNTTQYNVIAQVNGLINPDKIFILGAHYDNVVYPGDAFATTPGADDNASGTAAMLETARVFKLHNIQPDYTIRFVAFAAEELSLNGSNNYAGKVGNAQEDLVLMINNDMISHSLQPANNWKIKIQKYPQTDWVVNLTNQIAQQFTQLTVVVDSNDIAYSDSYLFSLWGYDAVFYQENDFFTSLHTTFDVIDSLDMAYAAELIKISCGVLLSTNLTLTGMADCNATDLSSSIYPNPVLDKMTLNINSKLNQKALISIFNLNNQPVITQEKLLIASGMNNIVFDLKHLSKGIYYCVIKTSQSIYCHKIIKL